MELLNMTSSRKQNCSLCGKFVVKLSRHLRLIHKVQSRNHMLPQTLKEFVEMIILFPITSDHWKVLCKHKNSIINYLENDTPLSNDIFSIVYQAFQLYKKPKSHGCEMAILKPYKKRIIDNETEKVKPPDESIEEPTCINIIK